MNAQLLLDQLGAAVGVALPLSGTGTCRVFFDRDQVDFEQTADALYIMADVASASGRRDAYGRLLAANCLGAESGGACLSLDAERDMFMLHTIIREDMPYPAFEKELTLFIQALRYWKEWLGLRPSTAGAAASTGGPLPSEVHMLRV